jgi:diacylglycerol kinase family enzyme
MRKPYFKPEQFDISNAYSGAEDAAETANRLVEPLQEENERLRAEVLQAQEAIRFLQSYVDLLLQHKKEMRDG